MRVGITGASGLIGWHLRCGLYAQGIEVAVAGRDTFGANSQIDQFVRQCDALVHLAGKNRGDEGEVKSVNVGLADSLVESLKRTESRPHLVFASSTQADQDNPYGASKRMATKAFSEWASSVGAGFSNLVLPHVFGEHGKPFYNSVVSTFCYQLARGENPQILTDATLDLMHAQEVSDLVRGLLLPGSRKQQELRPRGREVTVSGLLTMLREMSESYRSGVIPDIRDPFRCRLFNTYRSYLFPEYYPCAIEKKVDNRGSLFEAVKESGGGQTFLSTTKPGVTRGEHFHTGKMERFLVLEGAAEIRIRRLFHSEVTEYRVNGEHPASVDIPTLHTHSIKNVGKESLVTLFWSNEIFDPEKPDTFYEPV